MLNFIHLYRIERKTKKKEFTSNKYLHRKFLNEANSTEVNHYLNIVCTLHDFLNIVSVCLCLVSTYIAHTKSIQKSDYLSIILKGNEYHVSAYANMICLSIFFCSM